ncbi:wiskott-Aldrich syndrome protein family member 2 [Manihot esculenta]|uniref:DUF7086 domain-containing protein n=1 Tax=Manihot esculenta TaxID=3983 RepID=A0A2C9U6M0_MANES|nr:wiskott-Aldrich syndrome protein family member 2 [Manihot esculenta]OAY25499.1 hypothetical protein MANES_17G099600v8 [Manihot esculenta]
MNNQEDMKPMDQEISLKRNNTKMSTSSPPDFEELHGFISKRRREIDLDLSLRPRRSSPSPPLSSSPSPQLIPPHQEIPQLMLQIPTPAETQSPNPTLLRSHALFAGATTPHMAPPCEPSSHAAADAAAISPSLQRQEASTVGPSRIPRARRNPSQAPRDGKSENIPPPFPWATNHRATVHTLDSLQARKIETITGAVQCKRCEKQYEESYDLKEKFDQVGKYILENKNSMHDRAPNHWMSSILPACKYCGQKESVKPLISEKKKSINWLFLFLGEMLGCCTLEQLKYFCKHTKNHRTGAKDRVLYLTYLELCKQLVPNGPFGR